MPWRMNPDAIARDGERVLVEQHAIAGGVRRCDEAVLLEQPELLVGELGGLGQLGAGQAHAGCRRREIVGTGFVGDHRGDLARFRLFARLARLLEQHGLLRRTLAPPARRGRRGAVGIGRVGLARVGGVVAEGRGINRGEQGAVAIGFVEPVLDHLQRQEVLALLAQDEAQTFDVGRRRTCGTPTACVRVRRGPGSRGTGSSRS